MPVKACTNAKKGRQAGSQYFFQKTTRNNNRSMDKNMLQTETAAAFTKPNTI